MSKRPIIIYIPGLGDPRAPGQVRAVKLWKIWGVEPQVELMHWNDTRHFEVKLDQLLKVVDNYVKAGRSVGLVAASAGASAAINVFALRKEVIGGVALICGKIHNPQNMHYSVVKKNVAFGDALKIVPDALMSLDEHDRKRIMSIHPLADESVPVADTRIPGALERRIPVIGHFFGIAYGLTIYAPIMLTFLKRQTKLLAKYDKSVDKCTLLC